MADIDALGVAVMYRALLACVSRARTGLSKHGAPGLLGPRPCLRKGGGGATLIWECPTPVPPCVKVFYNARIAYRPRDVVLACPNTSGTPHDHPTPRGGSEGGASTHVQSQDMKWFGDVGGRTHTQGRSSQPRPNTREEGGGDPPPLPPPTPPPPPFQAHHCTAPFPRADPGLPGTTIVLCSSRRTVREGRPSGPAVSCQPPAVNGQSFVREVLSAGTLRCIPGGWGLR